MNKIDLALDMIELFEFSLEWVKDFQDENDEIVSGFHLVDWQGANLGNIEFQIFADLNAVLDRMNAYEWDYIVNNLVNIIYEKYEDFEYNSWEDIYNFLVAHKEEFKEDLYWTEVEYLDLIVHNYDELNNVEEIKRRLLK